MRLMRFLILFVAFFLLLGINSETNADLDLFQKGRILYQEGRFTEAIRVYQEIINNNPEDFKAYLNLAYLYKDLAEYRQATEVIREALGFFEDIRLEILLGRLYYLDGKPRQAISQLKALLSSDSKDAGLLFYLGLCYEDIGKLTDAEAFYLDAVRFKPSNVLAYLKLGNIYYQRRRYKQAAQTYQKVISLDPSITGVRPRLAECFTKLGESAEAYKQYARYVAIHPQDKLLQKKLEKIKTKLGEDFFQQKKAKTLQHRRRKSIQVEPSVFPEETPQVRVNIAGVGNLIEFKCGSDFEVIDQQSGDHLLKGIKESFYSLVFNKKANIQLKDYQGNVLLTDLDKPFLIKNKSENSVITIFDIPIGRGDFWANWCDQQYRGIIEVVPDNNGFRLINSVNLEEYLYGVLPSEMPANWPKQALCTQAIAARSWAIKNKTRHSRQGFNFCNTVHCQVYKGVGAETRLTNQAVDETAGIILVSGNQPIDIFYSNNCGGYTQDGVIDAVSLDFSFPLSPLELELWLTTEPDTFCNLKEANPVNFRWARCYKREQLQAVLGLSGIDIGEPLEIIPQKRARSGHLISIKIKGTKGSRVIVGENNIRKILGNLRSSVFKIETKFNQRNLPVEFIFYGGGFGHGRGLCQSGVKGMALKGYNYLEILKHYYPDAEIKKIY